MPKDASDDHHASREFTMLVPAYTPDPILALPGIKLAVREKKRSLPSSRRVAVSLGDCTINDQDQLCWRGRVWVPDYEPLRTGVI
ncbi:hypothetical protein COCSADRAFT_70670, partial [Bipolaris sorokiniana ND90Pr]